MSTSCAHSRAPECESYPNVRKKTASRERIEQQMMDSARTRTRRRHRLMTNNRKGRVRKPYYLSALASAFAWLISATNGLATAGTGTLPNSKA